MMEDISDFEFFDDTGVIGDGRDVDLSLVKEEPVLLCPMPDNLPLDMSELDLDLPPWEMSDDYNALLNSSPNFIGSDQSSGLGEVFRPIDYEETANVLANHSGNGINPSFPVESEPNWRNFLLICNGLLYSVVHESAQHVNHFHAYPLESGSDMLLPNNGVIKQEVEIKVADPNSDLIKQQVELKVAEPNNGLIKQQVEIKVEEPNNDLIKQEVEEPDPGCNSDTFVQDRNYSACASPDSNKSYDFVRNDEEVLVPINQPVATPRCGSYVQRRTRKQTFPASTKAAKPPRRRKSRAKDSIKNQQQALPESAPAVPKVKRLYEYNPNESATAGNLAQESEVLFGLPYRVRIRRAQNTKRFHEKKKKQIETLTAGLHLIIEQKPEVVKSILENEPETLAKLIEYCPDLACQLFAKRCF